MTSLFCQACQEVMVGEEAIRAHLELEPHKNVFQQPYSMKQLMLYCTLCNNQFSGPEPYMAHVNSKSHKKKASLQQNSTVHNAQNWTCQLCQVTCSGPEPYQQHLSSKGHNRELRKKELMEEQGLIPEFTPKSERVSLKCELCAQKFCNPDLFRQHIETPGHKLALRKQPPLPETRQQPGATMDQENVQLEIHPAQEPVNLTQESSISVKEYLQNVAEIHKSVANPPEKPAELTNCEQPPADQTDQLYNKILSPGTFRCEVCDIFVTGFIPYQHHLEGAKHKKKARLGLANLFTTYPSPTTAGNLSTQQKEMEDRRAKFAKLLEDFESDDDDDESDQKPADKLLRCTLCPNENHETIQELVGHYNSYPHALTIIRRHIAQNSDQSWKDVQSSAILHYIRNELPVTDNLP